jgi:hypothetical protein
MQNIQQNHERKYEKFQDLLSNIGGISSFIILIANAINLLVTNFIILLDTEELVLNIDKYKYEKEKFYKKPTILKRASVVLNPPKLKDNKYKIKNSAKKQQSSAFQVLLKDRLDLNCINNNNNIDAKSEPFNKLNFGNNNELNIDKYIEKKKTLNNFILPINIYQKDNNYNNNNRNDNKNEKRDKQSIIDSKSMNFSIKDSVHELETEIKEEKYKPIVKQNFTWPNYFCYLLTCKTRNQKISYYESFRTQIISEENMIQNHINIYKLLKSCEIDNIDPFKINNSNNIKCQYLTFQFKAISLFIKKNAYLILYFIF